jgi:hypothetical protein
VILVDVLGPIRKETMWEGDLIGAGIRAAGGGGDIICSQIHQYLELQ